MIQKGPRLSRADTGLPKALEGTHAAEAASQLFHSRSGSELLPQTTAVAAG